MTGDTKLFVKNYKQDDIYFGIYTNIVNTNENKLKNAQMQTKPISSDLKKSIEELVYEKDGVKFIGLGCYCLDFKHEYAFLGYTKNSNKVILGDIYSSSPDGIKYKKRFGTVDVSENGVSKDGGIAPCINYSLHTDGYRYSETIKTEIIGEPVIYQRPEPKPADPLQREEVFTQRFNSDGMEIDDQHHIIPKGKVMYGTDFILDLGNKTDYEFVIQKIRGKTKQQLIQANGERSLRLKLNKLYPHLKNAYNKPRFVTVEQYQQKLKERDEAILEATKLHREVDQN